MSRETANYVILTGIYVKTDRKRQEMEAAPKATSRHTQPPLPSCFPSILAIDLQRNFSLHLLAHTSQYAT